MFCSDKINQSFIFIVLRGIFREAVFVNNYLTTWNNTDWIIQTTNFTEQNNNIYERTNNKNTNCYEVS